jgi:hypothetical protein
MGYLRKVRLEIAADFLDQRAVDVLHFRGVKNRVERVAFLFGWSEDVSTPSNLFLFILLYFIEKNMKDTLQRLEKRLCHQY